MLICSHKLSYKTTSITIQIYYPRGEKMSYVSQRPPCSMELLISVGKLEYTYLVALRDLLNWEIKECTLSLWLSYIIQHYELHIPS